MPEPRDPLLKVLIYLLMPLRNTLKDKSLEPPADAWVRAARTRPGRGRRSNSGKFTMVWEFLHSVMIPPLVHQRRPCYDFYFL